MNNKELFKRVDNNKRINMIQDFLLPETYLNKVLKMHQQTTWHLPYNWDTFKDPELYDWCELVADTEVLPDYVEERIQLSPVSTNESNTTRSLREYKKDFQITDSDLSNILFKSFGRHKDTLAKNYPSAGGLYPIIAVLIVLDKNKIPFLKHEGSYIYDSRENELLLLKKFTEEDINKFRKCVDMPWEVPDIAMAYAMDIKRATTKYKFRGYRHALIEVGLMAQSFRSSLWDMNNFGECCWSGFSDNALTHLLGLSPRLAPVALLQWFGEKE
ncbi:nitroreductase family protein [Priestia aryabhattai]|uniref:nitroreductase family protein n=1 Tax=Priestia aryabhattai TaxID=412384 RepID=UPI002E23F1CC|nr:nitroreductase family protein [Priestia aryabhattai]